MRNDDQEQRRPDYQNYYPYQNYYNPDGRPKKKKHTGLLVILVALALITGATSFAVNVLGLRVDLGQRGLTIGFSEPKTDKTQQSSVGEQLQAASNVPGAPEQSSQTAAPVQSQKLDVQQSPQSVENRPVETEQALSLQEIYEKVFPSVASISCVLDNGTSSGTGIVMSADGYVITNYHVVDGARQIYVLLGENDRYAATLVGSDETTDLAVLNVEAADLTPAEFGDSSALRVGDMVVAIGDPLGTELRGTMTDGIVSAINRDLNLSGRQMTLIQTNAALNSGNSGGPLINCYGQVIGINTMKMSSYSSTSATVEGLGFAIPIAAAKPVIDELIAQGYVYGRPAIGIRGQNLDLRAQFFYHMPSGVVVTEILEDSDAAKKGLETDDIIVGLNDVTISSLDDLVSAKNSLTAGDTVTLVIYRGGQYYKVEVVLMDQISPEIY